MGVVIRRWVWLESIGVVSVCFPHITYISLLHLYLFFFAAASLLLFSFCLKLKWMHKPSMFNNSICIVVGYFYDVQLFFLSLFFRCR